MSEKKRKILIILFCIIIIIISLWTGYDTGHIDRLNVLVKINVWFFLQPALFGVMFACIQLLAKEEANKNITGLQMAMGNWLIPLACFIFFYVLFAGFNVLPPAWYNPQSDLSVFWFNKFFYLARLLVYPVLWLFIFYKLFFRNRINDASQIYPVVSLVILIITFHLICRDWFAGAEPGWYSTLFEWYMLSAMLAVGSAMFMMLGLFIHKNYFPFFTESLLTDWAKYLFGFSLLWGYMWYCQYMIIWQTAYEHEIMFYYKRYANMPCMHYAVFILCFVIPFLLLLLRKMKTNRVVLNIASLSILTGHWLELYFIFNTRLITSHWFGLFDLLLPVAMLLLGVSMIQEYIKNVMVKNSGTAIILILFILITACTNREKTGRVYYPDMYYPNNHLVVTGSMRMLTDTINENFPLSGIIPLHYIPYRYPKDNESRIAAGLFYQYSGRPGMNDIKTGKELYKNYCSMCHGNNGDGKGYLFVTDKYTAPPRSLLTQRVQCVPEGEIYHVIVRGFNLMQGMGAQINEADRWKIVKYVQSFNDTLLMNDH